MIDRHTQSTVSPGFSQPVHDSQQVFRAVLEAMSRPGTLVPLPASPQGDGGLGACAAAMLLTLADLETPVWLAPGLDSETARSFLRFHCGSPLCADPQQATFAVLGNHGSLPDLGAFALGDPAYPDRSATLIIVVPELGNGPKGLLLSGPGIDGEIVLEVPGLCPSLIQAHEANHELFPMGFDTILAGPDSLACLPRTTRIRQTHTGAR